MADPTATGPATVEAFAAAGVFAVLRAPSADKCIRAANALVAGGITGIEVTFSTPDAAAAIREIGRRHGDAVLVGAGTVLTKAQVQEARHAGARFLVSPGTDPQLVPAMVGTGCLVVAGALTPSEVMAAVRLGAGVVKIFPASVGGTGFFRALRGPFPDVPLMPTGGVDADNLGDWFAAGAVAVGAGSDLCPPVLMADGYWAEITERARRYRAAMDLARSAR